jgi:AcrR family transcriptional regulator
VPATPKRPRRTPRQDRSKEMVEAIVQAGMLVLREEGPERLTTKRIAERAGVAVGSLYRYFADKDDVLEAVFRQQHEEFWDKAVLWVPRLAALPLEKAVALIVDAGINRHRALYEMHPEFYLDHSVRYTLSTFHPNGPDRATKWVAMILDCHRDELAMASERAAFLLTRALGAVLVTSLRERPRYLSDPALRADLLRMAMGLIARDPPAPAGQVAKQS